MSNDIGGWAFPFMGEIAGGPYFSEGMTLRDYFAANAAQGILAGWDADAACIFSPSAVAHRAFLVADALLEVRNKT